MRVEVQDPAPKLIGSEWHRREPKGDDWDTVRIVGVFDGGEIGGMELCVSPVAFGPTMTCTAESLADAYSREADGPDVLAEVTHRLNQIQAGGV